MTTALVTAKRAKNGYWQLNVQHCPFCGKRHSHGGLNGDAPDLGPRVAPCAGASTPHDARYELVLAEVVTPRLALQEAMVLVEQTLRVKDEKGYPDWTSETDLDTAIGIRLEYEEWYQEFQSNNPIIQEAPELCDLIARCVMRLARLGKVGYGDGRGR